MKRILVLWAVLIVFACIALASPSFVMAQVCVIKWWWGSTGYVTTNETSRTEQARHEAFQAIFGDSGCSGPCGIIGCYPFNGYVPEGCDGFGDWGGIPYESSWCSSEILCDTGEWESFIT